MPSTGEPKGGTAESALALGETRPLLQVSGVVKSYPGVQALAGIDLTVANGEVRALLGKNGAGKSTLVEILSGAVRADSGVISISGLPVSLPNPATARRLGIATVHQELSLVPELSVADNILMGRWREAAGHGMFIKPSSVADYAHRYLDELNLAIDPYAKVATLSVAQQQNVEIARALSFGSKILILDEPTSSLPATEVEELLSLVRRLAAAGMAILFVSHRMDEIPRVADSVTVLRDGKHVDTRPISRASTSQIVELMTGGSLHQPTEQVSNARDRVVLSTSGLSCGDRVQDVCLELREGEILGLAGLLGSGRTELLRCLYGLDRPTSGTITVEGRPFTPRSTRQAIRAGLGFAPEERKKDGLALQLSVAANLTLASLDKVSHGPLLSPRRERGIAETVRHRLAIKTPTLQTRAGTLSGGNQQKIILGKWLTAQTRILLLDEPTRGVDIDAKTQIYELIRELAAAGTSIIVASSELEELFVICDRLVVLTAGRVIAQHQIRDTTPSAVMALAMEGSAL